MAIHLDKNMYFLTHFATQKYLYLIKQFAFIFMIYSMWTHFQVWIYFLLFYWVFFSFKILIFKLSGFAMLFYLYKIGSKLMKIYWIHNMLILCTFRFKSVNYRACVYIRDRPTFSTFSKVNKTVTGEGCRSEQSVHLFFSKNVDFSVWPTVT